MSEKIINARLQLKIDSHDNWVANKTVVLKNGEVAFDVVSVKDPTTSQYVPAVMAKVGDGTTTWENLKYMYAPAADVYGWAKAETKPTYSAAEITGIDTKIADYVSNEMGIEVDTDTQYSITKVNDYQYKLMSKSKGDATFATEVAVIDIPNNTEAITNLQTLVGSTSVATQIANAISALDLENTYEAKGTAATEVAKVLGTANDDATKNTVYGAKAAAKDAQDDIDALAAKVGTVTDGKTIAEMIAEAKSEATYDDTALKGRVSTLEGEDAGKSVRTISTEEATKAINDFATKVSDDGVVNSFKELVDWAAAHGSEAEEMVAAITAIQGVLDGIGGDGEKATVVAYVTDAIAALKIGDYAKAADLTALAARVTTLEGKSHEHTNKELLDSYTQTEANLADAVAKKHEHANKAELDKFATGDKAALDKAVADIATLNGDATTDGSVAKAVADAKTALNTEIAKKANDADLAAIAKTGNVNDLVQTEGDVVIFNCGSATVNI